MADTSHTVWCYYWLTGFTGCLAIRACVRLASRTYRRSKWSWGLVATYTIWSVSRANSAITGNNIINHCTNNVRFVRSWNFCLPIYTVGNDHNNNYCCVSHTVSLLFSREGRRGGGSHEANNLEFDGKNIPRCIIAASAAAPAECKFALVYGGLGSPLDRTTNPLRLVIQTALGYKNRYTGEANHFRCDLWLNVLTRTQTNYSY